MGGLVACGRVEASCQCVILFLGEERYPLLTRVGWRLSMLRLRQAQWSNGQAFVGQQEGNEKQEPTTNP